MNKFVDYETGISYAYQRNQVLAYKFTIPANTVWTLQSTETPENPRLIQSITLADLTGQRVDGLGGFLAWAGIFTSNAIPFNFTDYYTNASFVGTPGIGFVAPSSPREYPINFLVPAGQRMENWYCNQSTGGRTMYMVIKAILMERV